MRISYKIYIILIIALLGAAGGITLFSEQKSYSPNENRYLEKYPKLSLESVMSGDFQDDMINALNDQFFKRDNFMQVSSELKKMLGYKDIGGVYLAKDGYYIEKKDEVQISQERYMQNLRYVQYFLSKQKGSSSTILVPSGCIVLKDKMPEYASSYDAEAMYKAAETVLSSSKLIDIRDSLKEAEKSEQIYYRTDHHWTLKGAYEAYCEYCKEMGIDIRKYDEFNVKEICDNFYGSLYSKVLDREASPDKIYATFSDALANIKVTKDGKITDGIYNEKGLTRKDKYSYFFGGNCGRVDISTEVKNGSKLLVIKDSFANCFVPFLIDSYSEITMIDPRYYSGSITELSESGTFDHTIILYEMSNFAGDTNLYKLIEK